MIPPVGYELLSEGYVMLGDLIWATRPEPPHWAEVDEQWISDLGFLGAREVTELKGVCRRKETR